MIRKLFRRGEKEMTARLCSSGDFRLEVVGESFYQSEIRAVMARAGRNHRGLPEFRAVLVREPQNSADRNAVAVFADGFSKVGYLDREHAARYRAFLDSLRSQNKVAACHAIIVGEGKPSLGVILDFHPEDDCGTSE